MKHTCRTYFRISGDFEPRELAALFGLRAHDMRQKGERYGRAGRIAEESELTLGYNERYEVNINDMLRKTENAQLTLGEKAKSIQADMADFQKKLENNVFATRERAESEQARIVKRQEEYARLEQRLAGELAAEEQKNSIALRDSINNFMKEYNATHGYDIILSRIGENILFANEALDITKEVIDGLNKCYNEAE